MSFSKNPFIGPLKSKMAEIHHIANQHDVIFLPWAVTAVRVGYNFADWCRHVDCGDMVEIETGSRIPIWRTFGRIQWHVISKSRDTLHGERIPLPYWKSFFAVFYFFVFLLQFGLRRAAAFVSFSIHLFFCVHSVYACTGDSRRIFLWGGSWPHRYVVVCLEHYVCRSTDTFDILVSSPQQLSVCLASLPQ